MAGRPEELTGRQCATLAEHLIERGANATTAIHTAIETLRKHGDQKRSEEYARLNYDGVRKMLTRLRETGKWVHSGLGLELIAEAGLSNKYGASESARSALRSQEAALASTRALNRSYEQFLKTNPTAEARTEWLIEHEARVSGRKPRG